MQALDLQFAQGQSHNPQGSSVSVQSFLSYHVTSLVSDQWRDGDTGSSWYSLGKCSRESRGIEPADSRASKAFCGRNLDEASMWQFRTGYAMLDSLQSTLQETKKHANPETLS